MKNLSEFLLASCLSSCKEDLNCDSNVDGKDLTVLTSDFGRTNCASGPPCERDFHKDCDVVGTYLVVFADDFEKMDYLEGI